MQSKSAGSNPSKSPHKYIFSKNIGNKFPLKYGKYIYRKGFLNFWELWYGFHERDKYTPLITKHIEIKPNHILLSISRILQLHLSKTYKNIDSAKTTKKKLPAWSLLYTIG